MPADVHFWPLPAGPGAALAPPDLRPGLRRLVAACGLEGAAAPGAPWPLRLPLGPVGRPAPVSWESALATAAALTARTEADLPPGPFVTDTLSISTRGLDTAAGLREAATRKGFALAGMGPDSALPFMVGDDPAGPAARELDAVVGANGGSAWLAGGVEAAAGLVLLTPLRPHPHLGVAGSVAALGLDLLDRESRLLLHGGIRPQVDTPLCAGCGSCLDVCLYDAIVIRGGRAVIDHRLCTGCGECMGVCFMAGIAPEATDGIVNFQSAVARAALAVAGHFAAPPHQPVLYLNFLVQLDNPNAAGRARRRPPLTGIGILASRDPVAVDVAALTLLADRLGEPLDQWSGYRQEPGPLLARAEALGLGEQAYRLLEV